MTRWPRWPRASAPGALAQYAQGDVTARLLPADLARQLSGPSNEPPWYRARAIYDVFAQCGITYVHELISSEPGRQAIRPPDEVLHEPRRGTCLDIAVTFSGACLDAGLHPMIVVLDSVAGAPGHALVVVWLDGSWARSAAADYPWQDAVHNTPPAELTGQVRASVDQPGSFVAIDVTRVTRATQDASATWDTAVATGAAMLTEAISTGRWRWGVGVDVGVAWHREDVLPLPHVPESSPLSPAYHLQSSSVDSPLMQLRARRGVVPFYGRDQLDLLLDWCQAPDTEQRTGVAVVHGVGGAGKTHLTAELATRLTAEGWYTGFLTRQVDPADLRWLAGLVAPLLVVLDYAEDAQSATAISLIEALRGRPEPACVVLTARGLGGWWREISSSLTRDGIPFAALPPLELPRRHPSVTGVFQRARRAFAKHLGTAEAEIDNPPHNPRWTTLDLVMLAWLAAHGTTALPNSPSELYDEILVREFDYWSRVCAKRGMSQPPERLLRAVGACVTLLAPTPERVTEAIRAVPDLTGAPEWRTQLAAVIESLLPPDSDTGTVTIRPDPVGERLILRELRPDGTLFRRCLRHANDEERFNACVAITRATEQDDRTATELAAATLTNEPEMWRPALAVTAAQGSPFEPTLLALADRDDSPLPLQQLADTIPLGHVTLRALALTATLRSRPPEPAGTADHEAPGQLAAWWNNLSLRQSDTGDRDGALASITEAVTHYRRLAEAQPAAFLPDLAGSLNNLSLRQSDTGDRDGALASITEAVTHYRRLAEAQPAAFLPDLAGSLNNLSLRQSDTGDRDGALASITEAVTHYRRRSPRPNPPPSSPTSRRR